jgi:hypothetical protein
MAPLNVSRPRPRTHKSHDLWLSVRFFPEPFGEHKTTQCGGRTDSKLINQKPFVKTCILIDSFNICKNRVN